MTTTPPAVALSSGALFAIALPLVQGQSQSSARSAASSDGFGAALYFLVAVNAALVVLVQLLPRDRTEVAA